MTKRALPVLVLAGILASLAACGGDSGGGPTDAAAEPDDELETTELTVGALPLPDYGALYWADENGLFEEEGLDVTLEPLQGGPVGIQQVAAGQIECSFANTFSTMIAQEAGTPVDIVALSSAIGDGSQIYVTAPDSPIQSIEDIQGVTVGVHTTNNIPDLLFLSLAEEQGVGVDPEFVEVPLGEMIDGIRAGSIDVGYTPEPFATAAKDAGLRPVVDLTEGSNSGIPAATFICGEKFIQDNPDTTAAFARALYAAGTEMAENEDELRSWLPGVAGVPEDTAQKMILPQYYSETQPDELQRVADLLAKRGLLKEEYDLDEHLFLP